jgi:hypothetical protein
MPNRLITSAIVAFWLGMAGLFCYQALWPRLMPAEPAMFPVDIVDEAGPQSERTTWSVTKNGGEGYGATTDWEYVPDTDTFQSHCQLNRGQRFPELPRAIGGPWLPQFHEVKADSHYYLTRDGLMTGIDATATYTLAVPALAADGLTVSAKVTGKSHAGRFVPELEMTFPALPGERAGSRGRPDPVKRQAAPAAVSPRGIVLNPLHPPRRLPALRPGQRWQVTLIDPFALLDLVGGLGPAAGEQLRRAGVADDTGADVLEARVLPGLETLYWAEKGEDVTCRVIRCGDEGSYPALTLWVRERDGMLYQQEAVTRSGDVWVFTRRPFNYQMRQAAPDFPPLVTEPGRLISVIGQTFAARAVAPGGPPVGTLAQHAAALGVAQTQPFNPPLAQASGPPGHR